MSRARSAARRAARCAAALALAVEQWTLPDGTHFVELSFKVTPDQAASAGRAFHALLEGLGIGREGDPDPKTPKVLRFFADRLRRG